MGVLDGGRIRFPGQEVKAEEQCEGPSQRLNKLLSLRDAISSHGNRTVEHNQEALWCGLQQP